jgi:selenocysteine lyase/cysteine desulfurase
MLDCQKELFDLPEEVVYFNCASQSPLLKTIVTAGQTGLAGKARPWTQGAAQRFKNADHARALFARLIGATANDIALIPSVSYGTTIAANNLPVKAGQKIVMVAEEFPSDVYPWREVALKNEAKILAVSRPSDHDWTTALLSAIDQNTAIVSVGNCHWTDGSLIDLEKIGAKARAVGAALVIDATQSMGAYPFEVQKVQPDFLVVATYKWLMGPYTMGFLYVSPKWQNGTPLEFGWLHRAGSDDYSKVAEYVDE